MISTIARLTANVLVGDCRELLAAMPADSVQTCVTSPPYWCLRDYGVDGQLGLEPTPTEYVERMVEVFREVRRVLRPDGTLWLNLGDTYSTHVGQGTRGGPPSASSTLEGTGHRGGGPKLKALRKVKLDIDPKSGVTRKRGQRPQRSVATGLKHKDLAGIPWRVALALQADGWWLRQEIIWAKGNPMPESISDRPTRCHEQVFLLAKAERYFYDAKAIAEPTTGTARPRGQGVNPKALPGKNESAAAAAMSGPAHHLRDGFNARWKAKQNASWSAAVTQTVQTRNARSVWFINSQPYSGAHFACFPEALAQRCILAGSRPGDLVLDPFAGSGTTGAVALKEGRSFIGCELNPDYAELARERMKVTPSLFAGVGS